MTATSPQSANTTARVRFAPSPTGHIHVGGARTAIFNWLFARHQGGKFIIRVEDTDQARSTRESEDMVLNDLRWLGLQWDEGPDIGGPHAPYRQSERMEMYRKIGDQLIMTGAAYRCFCTEEELDRKRAAAEAEGRAPHYDLTCYRLSPEERARRAAAGEPFATRFHVPKEEPGARFDADVTIDDIIRGEVTWKKDSLGDFIIIRSDQMPTYNFSVVVDDHDMEISHVIRAEEHLTNTHRQVLIYRAMDWDLPRFAHVSLILGEDRSKLSKRHGATSVAAYAEEGYLPEAMVNYLTLLGWSPPDGNEIFTAVMAAREFTLERVNSSPAIFDKQKFEWLNGQYLHQLTPSALAPAILPRARARGWVVDETNDVREWLGEAADLVKKNVSRVTQVADSLAFMFEFDPSLATLDDESAEAVKDPQAIPVIRALADDLKANGSPKNPEEYQALVERLKATGAKGKKLFMPVRVALTGLTHGPELARMIPLLDAGSRIKGLAPISSPLERVQAVLGVLPGVVP